jgi:hypothetical protein
MINYCVCVQTVMFSGCVYYLLIVCRLCDRAQGPPIIVLKLSILTQLISTALQYLDQELNYL